jgi:hypothetical protein
VILDGLLFFQNTGHYTHLTWTLAIEFWYSIFIYLVAWLVIKAGSKKYIIFAGLLLL